VGPSTNNQRGGVRIKTAQQADTVASRQVFPMVDHVAGTGLMLWRLLEGAEETLT
jgi:hypothetical protein